MTLKELFLAEHRIETGNTRKYLERVPEDKLDFKPHEKSTSLGDLAWHLADMPGWIPLILKADELDLAQPFEGNKPSKLTLQLILDRFDNGAKASEQLISQTEEGDWDKIWTMKYGQHIITANSKAVSLRDIVINHCYHHRGQLSVYLRLLNVPLPPVYGPTADDNMGLV